MAAKKVSSGKRGGGRSSGAKGRASGGRRSSGSSSRFRQEPTPFPSLIGRLLEIAGVTERPVAEFRFVPDRLWRFDYAWPALSVAVEIEGGVWSAGRHVQPLGFTEDCRKYNRAAADGWLVFRWTTGMLAAEPVQLAQQLGAVLLVRAKHQAKG